MNHFDQKRPKNTLLSSKQFQRTFIQILTYLFMQTQAALPYNLTQSYQISVSTVPENTGVSFFSSTFSFFDFKYHILAHNIDYSYDVLFAHVNGSNFKLKLSGMTGTDYLRDIAVFQNLKLVSSASNKLYTHGLFGGGANGIFLSYESFIDLGVFNTIPNTCQHIMAVPNTQYMTTSVSSNNITRLDLNNISSLYSNGVVFEGVTSVSFVFGNTHASVVGKNKSILLFNLASSLDSMSYPLSYETISSATNSLLDSTIYACIELSNIQAASSEYFLNVYQLQPFFVLKGFQISLLSPASNLENLGTMQYLVYTVNSPGSRVLYSMNKLTYQIEQIQTSGIRILPNTIATGITIDTLNHFMGAFYNSTDYVSYGYSLGTQPQLPLPEIPIDYSPSLIVDSTMYQPGESIISIRFSSELTWWNFSNIKVSLMSAKDSTLLTSFFTVKKIGLNQNDNKIVDITIEFKSSVFESVATISHINSSASAFNSSSNRYFLPSNNITVNNISRMVDRMQNIIDKAAPTLSIVWKSIAYIITAVLLSLHYQSGILMIKTVNYLQLLYFLNGKIVYYPEKFLELFRNSFFFVKIGNPFRLNEDNIECEPALPFKNRGASCNLLNNAGTEIMMIIVVFIVTITIATTNYLLKLNADLKDPVLSEKFRSKTFFKFVDNLHKIYGLHFFLIFMEGMMLEILLFSILNIATVNSKPGHLGTFFLALSFLVYYIVFSVSCFVYVRSFLHKRTELQISIEHLDAQIETKNINSLEKDLENQIISLNYILRYYRKNRMSGFYYLPVFELAKNVTICCSVVLLSNSPPVQSSLVLSAELIQLAFLVSGRVKKKLLDNAIDIFFSVLIVGYMLCRLITLYVDRFETSQYVYGGIMIFCCAMILFVDVLYCCSNFVYHFTLFTARLCGLKDAKLKEEASEDFGNRVNPAAKVESNFKNQKEESFDNLTSERLKENNEKNANDLLKIQEEVEEENRRGRPSSKKGS